MHTFLITKDSMRKKIIQLTVALFPCFFPGPFSDSAAGDILKAMAAAGDPLWLAMALDLEAMALAALAAVVIW